MSEALTDRQARERATGELNRSFFVEAAAGAGKTTVMVERVANLILEKDIPPDRIVAITFTENAAAELKMKVRRRLAELLIQTSEPEMTARIHRCLEKLDEAPISTIHSFCASILREHPVEAGIDPDFAVADAEITAPRLNREAWKLWLEQEAGGSPEGLEEGMLAGLSIDRFRDIANCMQGQRDRIRDSGLDDSFDLESHLRYIYDTANEISRQLPAACHSTKDSIFKALDTFINNIDSTRDLPEYEKIRALGGIQFSTSAQFREKNWISLDACEELKEKAERISRLNPLLNHPVLVKVVEWLKGFLDFYAELKRRHGYLDFDDLLIHTRDLLRHNKAVRRDLQQRYRHILIDEFQDTDPLQTEILWFLAEDEPKADAWEQVTIAPGRLFVVGDPKQSIFRFRHADIELYQKARRFFSDDEHLELSTNFRCSPPIINYVNGMFGELIQPSQGAYYQPDYVDLMPFRKAKESAGVVYILPDADNPEKPLPATLDLQRILEAELIARWLRRTFDEGRLKVEDPYSGEWRPVQPGDVTLLFRKTGNFRFYEDALRNANVPYYVQGGKTFYTAQEVQTLISLLRATDLPHNGIDFVAALRSPVFACSDDAIFICKETRGLNYAHLAQLNVDKEAEQIRPVIRAAKTLAKWKALSREISIAALAEKIIADCHLEVLSALQRAGERQIANLRKLVQIIRDLESAGPLTLRGAADYLAQQQSMEIEVAESMPLEETENVVRLLTMHKAKGLEYPLVILADLQSGNGGKNYVKFFKAARGEHFELKVNKTLLTAGFDSAEEEESRYQSAEETRLLYVAATRARDLLVIPWIGEKGELPANFIRASTAPTENREGGTMRLGVNGDIVVSVAAEKDLPSLPPLRGSLREAIAKADPKKVSHVAKDALSDRNQWLESRKRLADESCFSRRIKTPSSLAEAEDRDFYRDSDTEEDLPAFGQEDALRIGSAVHEILERINLPDGTDRGAILEQISRRENLTEAVRGKVEELVGRAVQSADFKRIANAREIIREAPFCMNLNGVLVEGMIDCLFRDEAGWWVVDYKTNKIPRQGLEPLKAQYRPQCDAYRQAVEQITGQSPAGCLLFFLDADPPEMVKV